MTCLVFDPDLTHKSMHDIEPENQIWKVCSFDIEKSAPDSGLSDFSVSEERKRCSIQSRSSIQNSIVLLTSLHEENRESVINQEEVTSEGVAKQGRSAHRKLESSYDAHHVMARQDDFSAILHFKKQILLHKEIFNRRFSESKARECNAMKNLSRPRSDSVFMTAKELEWTQSNSGNSSYFTISHSILEHKVFSWLYVVACDGIFDHSLSGHSTRFAFLDVNRFLEGHIKYHEHGAINLGQIFKFIYALDELFNRHNGDPDVSIAIKSRPDAASLSSTALLVGAYMILRLECAPDDVEAVLRPLSPPPTDQLPAEPFASPGYPIRLRDHWGALQRARQLDWVPCGPDGFDVEEYDHYGSLLHFDLHELIPGKLVVMRGPQALPGGAPWRDVPQPGRLIRRDFSPAHMAGALTHFGVRAVVRLCEPEYPADALAAHGIAHADIFCDVGAPPSAEAVAKFLRIAEALPGPLALHSRASLGRTGVFAGLLLMRRHGFTAREAVAWVRLVRPGSVASAQDAEYLADREATMRRTAAPAADDERGGGEGWSVGSGPGDRASYDDAARRIASALAAVDALLEARRRRRELRTAAGGGGSIAGSPSLAAARAGMPVPPMPVDDSGRPGRPAPVPLSTAGLLWGERRLPISDLRLSDGRLTTVAEDKAVPTAEEATVEAA